MLLWVQKQTSLKIMGHDKVKTSSSIFLQSLQSIMRTRGMLFGHIKLYSLMQVFMTLTCFQDHRDTKKRQSVCVDYIVK